MLGLVIVACGMLTTPETTANPLNDALVAGEFYIWNRVADLLEVVRCGGAIGPAFGAEIAVTEYAQIGAYKAKEKGVTFPHFFPPLWIVPYMEEEKVFVNHEGEYKTWSFGTHGTESSQDKAVRFPRGSKDVRVQVAVGLAHLYVNWDMPQTADFLAGLICMDPQDDDIKPVDTDRVREPGRQLSRGIINMVTGPIEIPFNVHTINQADGGWSALTYGLFRGLWRFGARELIGAFEIVTFPLGWDAIIEPSIPFEPLRSTDWRIHEPGFKMQY